MYIYKTIFPNGKIYIGQTKHDNPKYFGSGVIISNYISSYGKDNLKKEILRFCKTQTQLDFWETYYIKKFKSSNNEIGYNILEGSSTGFGYGNPMKLQLVRDKVRSKLIGNKNGVGYKPSKESKDNMSLKMKGNKNATGNIRSLEVRRRKSEEMKGNKISLGIKKSPELIEKIRKSSTGLKRSEETKKRISVAVKLRLTKAKQNGKKYL